MFSAVKRIKISLRFAKNSNNKNKCFIMLTENGMHNFVSRTFKNNFYPLKDNYPENMWSFK